MSTDSQDAGNKRATFYGDMERLLKKQLEGDPADQEVRLKLVELYYDAGRKPDFQREAHALRSALKKGSHTVEWNRVVSMARMLGLNDRIFEQSFGDSIEFVVPVSHGAPGATHAYQRIGEDERHRAYFQNLIAPYEEVHAEPRFMADIDLELVRIANRPSSLEDARRLSTARRGAQIYFKREDLSPRGSLTTISVVGQAMFARRIGKLALVTATVTGFRGIVTAAVGARMGLRVIVHMDRQEMTRRTLQVFQMRMLGAEIVGVDKQAYQGNDVRLAALEYCAEQSDRCFMVLALDAGPPPYPMMTREFLATLGRECHRQARALTRQSPDLLVARASNRPDAIGFFEPFLSEGTHLVCVEGQQILTEKALEENPFDPSIGKQDEAENLLQAISQIDLEQPPMMREHSFLKTSGRVEYVEGRSESARKAIRDLARLEGILAPIETAYAIGWALEAAARMSPQQVVVIMLAESADKDLNKLSGVFSDFGQI